MPSMPPRVQALIDTYDPATGCYDDPPGYIHTELPVLNLLYHFCLSTAPQRIIETGVYKGLSTCFFAAAMRDADIDGKIIGIDPFPQDHLWNGSELESYVEYIEKFSAHALPDVIGKRYDMLFLDSEHSYKTVITELNSFEPLVRPGGYILFHDSLWHDGVGHAIRAVYDSPRFEVITMETPRAYKIRSVGKRVSMGLTIARKISDGAPFGVDQGWLNFDSQDPMGEDAYLRMMVQRRV